MTTATDLLDQRRAEILGRQFNAALTNATAYGADHPQMHRACETFCNNLTPVVEALGELTLMLDRGALFIEDYRADENFNANRILQLFRTLGLQSLTFQPGVDVDAISAAMQNLVLAEELENVEAYKAALNEQGVTSIKVNHIVLKKLTADDEVIEREGLAELTDLAEQASEAGAARREEFDSGDLLGRIESIFAMRNLIDPDEDSDGEAAEGDPSNRVVAQIRALGGRVGSGRGGTGGGDGDVSLDVVLDAVETLKRDLSETMADQKEVARFMSEHGGVIDEIDQLTYRTVVALVCDEYRAGTTSARRLAQIIRRLLPDSRDIKRLLPMLKGALTDEGMSLSSWLQFVRELSGELKSENLVQVLSEGADEVGLAVDDIVREIQHDPGEAARLIVLASELRRGSGDDSDRLSAVLADHIEHATVELLPDAGGRATATRFNRDSIRKVQQELLDKVRRQGMDETVLGKVAEALDGRFEDFLGKARSRQVDDFLSTSKTMDPRDVVEALEKMVDSRADIERMDGTLRRALKDRGLEDDAVQNVLDQALTRVRKKNRIELIPGDALDPNATRYFLNREILSAVRYKTHFSALMLMIARIRTDGEDWRAITPEEIEGVMPRILDALPLHLRDLDLLGTLGSKFKNVPLAILPMTPQEGADHVLERILEGLNASTFELGEDRVQLRVVGTAERFDPEKTEDGKQFVQALRGKLASHLVHALRAG